MPKMTNNFQNATDNSESDMEGMVALWGVRLEVSDFMTHAAFCCHRCGSEYECVLLPNLAQ
jgi:hypothetical protein